MPANRHPETRNARTSALKARLLELICACAFAFAQPLFDLIGQNPEFLVAHSLYGASLLLFALALVALPPEIRPAYVAACKHTLVEQPGGLLISFEYDQRQMQ